MRRHSSAFGRRPWRTCCAWSVVFALVWGMLASHFVHGAGNADSGWTQICTAHGIELVQLDAALTPEGQGQDEQPSLASDCPWCRLQSELALEPAPANTPALRLSRKLPRGPPSTAAVSTDPAWRPGLPRAPPPTTPA